MEISYKHKSAKYTYSLIDHWKSNSFFFFLCIFLSVLCALLIVNELILLLISLEMEIFLASLDSWLEYSSYFVSKIIYLDELALLDVSYEKKSFIPTWWAKHVQLYGRKTSFFFAEIILKKKSLDVIQLSCAFLDVDW